MLDNFCVELEETNLIGWKLCNSSYSARAYDYITYEKYERIESLELWNRALQKLKHLFLSNEWDCR